MASNRLTIQVEKAKAGAEPPSHHVIDEKPNADWTSYLPSWNSTAEKSNSTTGFRNPWPSWHKPTRQEIWDALQWGPDTDPCIPLAASHLAGAPAATPPPPSKRPNFSNIADWPSSTGAQAARLLRLKKPDFSFDSSSESVKATWLGHAGVLVQLPPLQSGGEPVRCVFDPIFSMRCSPSQTAGPIRSYPAPCKVEDLPPIHLYFLSHNHYDHLDYDTVNSLWSNNKDTIRFLVPLGNLEWFTGCGIPAERVTEMDWWDSADLAFPKATTSGLRVWCTPAQHSSGRAVGDAESTLWSGWYLEHPRGTEGKPCRVFFAGDSGYQFHDSPSWPPSPPSQLPPPATENRKRGSFKSAPDEKFPVCPIFKEIRSRLGSPHLLLLPVAVGATYSYLRSFVYLPDSISPFPRHNLGLTAAAHMPPWDAVRVLQDLTGAGDASNLKSSEDEDPPVAIAMHWGTFVTDPVEVLKTLGQLEWACQQHDVVFNREIPKGRREKLCFLALDHGQSISI